MYDEYCYMMLCCWFDLGNKKITGGDPKTGGMGVRDALRIGIAEMVGTALLVFLGCLGCVSGLHHGPLPPLQPAIMFGCTVTLIIQMIAHISKAHINPSITVAAVVLGETTWRMGIVYVLAQCIGAICGYGLIKLMLAERILLESSGDHGFCTTVPNPEISVGSALLAEFMATTVLVLVLCASWDRRNSHLHDSVAIKFGITIAALAIAFGGITGASMNPARSLGPAFWNNEWTKHYVYWVSPLSSALIISLAYRTYYGVKDEPSGRKAGDGGEGAGIPLNQQPGALEAADNAANMMV